MQSVECCFVYAILDTMPFVGKDGLDDGGEYLVLCRSRCNFINCHCFGGWGWEDVVYIFLCYFFVLCRLVVGALDGGWDSHLGYHGLICIWRSCRMVAFSKTQRSMRADSWELVLLKWMLGVCGLSRQWMELQRYICESIHPPMWWRVLHVLFGSISVQLRIEHDL